ncbi:MAG: hypothetical protein IPK93_06970, partial [Solirubrobacterales bacterium]|nr:hypothetical protein [Solirubrobacterales bacterium]
MNFADENEEPINAETAGESASGESPEVERAVSDVGGSSELAGEMEKADEANADDDVSVAADVEAADSSSPAVGQTNQPIEKGTGVINEPAPAQSHGEYVADDGQILGRDFTLPGVAPGDNDPYKWHTGSKIDHGGVDAIEINN